MRTALTGGLACDVCGRLPHPRRLRLTVAKLLAIFPVEFALHAIVLALHPSYLIAVSVLVVVTTALVIWITNPGAVPARPSGVAPAGSVACFRTPAAKSA